MAATKVWKKFAKVEKGILILLCAGMLLTLGIGGGMVFGSCDDSVEAGAVSIDGDEVSVDPAVYDQFQQRQFRFLRVLQVAIGSRAEIDRDEIERRFLLLMLARNAGIKVTDDSVGDHIESFPFYPWNREEQRFNQERYREILKRFQTQTRDFEESVREHLEIQQYMSNLGYVLGPTREEIYGVYKARNKKLSVEYTWQSLDPFEAEVDKDRFTPEEIQEHYEKVKALFQLPPRWIVESAFVVFAEMTDAEFETFYEETIADEALRDRYREIVGDENAELKVSFRDGWNYFLRQESVFSETARRRLEKGPDAPEKDGPEKDADDAGGAGAEDSGEDSGEESEDESVDEEAGEVVAGEVGPDGVEPGEVEPGEVVAGEEPVPATTDDAETDGEEGEPSAATAEGETAERELSRKERYRTYWTGFVRKEIFARRMARMLIADAKKPDASLSDLATRYGFRFHRSKMVSSDEIRILPIIGSPALRDEVVAVKPANAPKVLPRVLPLTTLDVDIIRRGWQVVRVAEAKAREPKPLADVEKDIRDRLFEQKVEDLGLAAMTALKEAAEKPDADFAALAAEKGLSLRTLEAFNANSPRASVDQTELESEDEAVRKAARERALDARVMSRGFQDVRALGGDRTISNPLTDRRTNSVLLIHLLGREDPAAEEMSVDDVRSIRRELQQAEFERLSLTVLKLESLRERLGWKPPTYGGGE